VCHATLNVPLVCGGVMHKTVSKIVEITEYVLRHPKLIRHHTERIAQIVKDV
jgi:hypothetical protein